jgi:presenilin-like A22 family membrane protease
MTMTSFPRRPTLHICAPAMCHVRIENPHSSQHNQQRDNNLKHFSFFLVSTTFTFLLVMTKKKISTKEKKVFKG